jgi:DNA-binding NarL/FixJ family response regulator
MSTACRVLIADDHALFRQGLCILLRTFPDLVVVGEATDGAEAISLARELRPDIVLMDINMPGCDGLEATAAIRREAPDVKVIVLTVNTDDPELVYQSIKAGAVGYLPKIKDIEELVNTIRRVAAGEAAIASHSLTQLVSFIGDSPEGVGELRPSAIDSLSPREREVLDLVAEGRSNREIAAQLCVSESTIHSHLHNILDKLGLHNRVQAVNLVLTTRQARPSGSATVPRRPSPN